MNKITLPPWHIIKGATGDLLILDASGDWLIARINGVNPLMEENANLISAAPDLLEALQNIENDGGIIPANLWKIRSDAIAKALGETP